MNRSMGPLDQPEEKRHAAAAADFWQAEALPIPIVYDDEPDARPVAVVVTAAGAAIYGEMLPRLGGEIGDVADVLETGIVSAAHGIGSFPPIVRVRHVDVALELARRVGPREVVVHATEPLEDIEELYAQLLEGMNLTPLWPPASRTSTWTGWMLPPDTIEKVFAAAATFWRAAPWGTIDDSYAPVITAPSGRRWTAVVLGNAGEEYGLSLYSRREDLALYYNLPEGGGAPRLEGRMLGLSFDASDPYEERGFQEARRAGWEIATPGAFPSLLTMNTPGGGISRDDAADLIAVLRAIPDFVAHHEDALVRERDAMEPGDGVHYRHEETGSLIEWDPAEDAALAAADESLLRGVPDSLVDEIDAAIRKVQAEFGDDADPAELMQAIRRHVADRADAYNHAPQEELGGLSPLDVHSLMTADWLDPDSVMHVRTDLAPQDVADTPVLRRALIVLNMAIQQDGLPATERGYLRVAVVRDLVDRLELPEPWNRTLGKRVIESDVSPLHTLRAVLGMAGLIHRRKGRFHATARARTLIAPDRHAELYTRLLDTWLRKLDLDSADMLPVWPELQNHISYSIRRFAGIGHEWWTAPQLLDRIVLPAARARAGSRDFLDLPAAMLAHRLLAHLETFGLAKRREVSGQSRGLTGTTWRATDLLRGLFEFAPELPARP